MTRFSVTCPHCQALLELDAEKQLVIDSKVPEKPKSTVTIEGRLQALADAKESAKAKLEEAMRSERAGASIRDERFKKLLEEAKTQPIEKPIRDIDID
jgi:hypothetical protein